MSVASGFSSPATSPDEHCATHGTASKSGLPAARTGRASHAHAHAPSSNTPIHRAVARPDDACDMSPTPLCAMCYPGRPDVVNDKDCAMKTQRRAEPSEHVLAHTPRGLPGLAFAPGPADSPP